MSASTLVMSLAPTAPQVLANVLLPTPRQSRGPFYPAEIPLDSDNDLVKVQGRSELAEGVITHVYGKVRDARGRSVAGARLEIWQCNAFGRYHHPRDRRDAPVDDNFQGYGRFTAGSDGAYRFRTIKPVPYPGRAPHIHFAVSGPGIERLVTQMYVAGAPENDRDFLLNNIRDRRARESLIVPLVEHPDATDELVGRFDLVLIADGRYG